MGNTHDVSADEEQVQRIVQGLPPQVRQQSEARYQQDMERLRTSHPRRLRMGRMNLQPRPKVPKQLRARARSSCPERRPGGQRARAHAPPGSDDPGGDDPPGDHAGTKLGVRYEFGCPPPEERS